LSIVINRVVLSQSEWACFWEDARSLDESLCESAKLEDDNPEALALCLYKRSSNAADDWTDAQEFSRSAFKLETTSAESTFARSTAS